MILYSFKRPNVFFRAHLRFILGRCQSRNHGKGAKGASVPLAKSFSKNNEKKQLFKRVLDLTLSIRGLKRLDNLMISMTSEF